MNRTQLENAIFAQLYEWWIRDSQGSLEMLLPNLNGVSEKELSLLLEDLVEAGYINDEGFGGVYSLAPAGVMEAEDRQTASHEVIRENVRVRSAIVQRAFDVRENEGRDADVNIDDVISDFELQENAAFRNARLMSELGWIEFRTARLYVITPFGRKRYREQLNEMNEPDDVEQKLVFETIVNTYRIAGQLGQGGVGTVYDVVDLSGQHFALKIISENVVSGEKVKRFHNELRFLARNRHQNLVALLDEGFVTRADRKLPFYVMPKYDSTLRHLIVKTISPDKILKYFEDLLSGVEFLHSKGIHHRDLKPENVLYDASADRLLIADLGAAHFAEEELHTLVETKTGARLANFQYAAPEQREKGKEVTHLADLFALGLILNEMFTRAVPHGDGYPKISEVNPDYSNLDDVVARLIKHRPKNRYQSVNELVIALSDLGYEGYVPGERESTGNAANVTQLVSGSNGDQQTGEKTKFDELLDEMDRVRGEKARQAQKVAYFNSQEGEKAALTAFNALVEITEKRLTKLKKKDSTFVFEKIPARRALIVKSSGFSISYALEVTYKSEGTKYVMFEKYWKGMLSSNPNAFYFDPERQPTVIEEVQYELDIDGANHLCWLNLKDGSKHFSQNLLDQSLAWLIKQVISDQRNTSW